MRGDADRRAMRNGCWFDEPAAERVREFFRRYLRHSKGEWAGKPFELQPWQWESLIGPLFGWKRADGTRRFRRAYIEIPKKNGKSAICSAIALYLLIADGEAGAEIYSAAADKEQASIVHGEAAHMVQASAALQSRLEVIRSTKRIIFPARNSWYKALSADVPTKEGLNAHGIIFDELHAQRTRTLWDTLAYAGSARRQPLQIAITTAGFDRHSICYEQHDYAEKVLSGVIEDDSFFPLIFAASPEEDWTREATWRKANPSFGVTVKPEAIATDCREAQESPRKENAFRRYHLNQWTEQDVRWLKLEKWDACGDPLPDLAGRPCFAGLDLASSTDIAALALLFPWDSGDGYDLVAKCWVPAEGAAVRSRKDRVPYELWIGQKHIIATEGDVIDYERIRRDIGELGKTYNIREIAFDRWGAVQLATQLQGDGFAMVAFGQGFASMSAPTKQFETLVLGKRLRHGGNPVLRWMASNVAVETDAAANLKPSKSRSREKIDGIVAAVMALGRAMVAPRAASVYEGRGVIVV